MTRSGQFFQHECEYTIAEQDVTEANFGSIGAIARFVHGAVRGERRVPRPHLAA